MQLHHSPELKWNKVRQKTSCDWGFKVVASDQSLKDTQIFFLSIFGSLSISFTCCPFSSGFHFTQLVGYVMN